MDAEHHRAQHDGCHQAGGEGQEALAQAHKINGLFLSLFFTGLLSTIEPRVAQSFDGSCAADHDAGGEYAEHKVQQHAGEQRVAEGIDRTGSGRAEGEEHEVQCLGKEAVRGAESAHQHDGHDDDGHVAVNDGGQAAGKAALQSAVQRLAILQLFFDALGGDDVGVHAHADGQNDTGDAGQRQGKAFKHREVAGDEGQRCRHLTGQRDAGQETGQTVQRRHKDHDQGKGDQTGHDHGAQAVLAQTGAECKGQCAGVDLAGHLDNLLLCKGVRCRTGDDGRTVGNGGVDCCGADVFIIQPDADGAVAGSQLCGGIAKGLGSVIRKLQRNVIFRCTAAADGAILRRRTLNHGAVEDQFAVGAAALAKRQVSCGADFLDRSFRVKVRFAGLPRKLQNQAVGVGIHIQFIVGDIECHKAVLNDEPGSIQLLLGGVVAIGRNKCDVYAALDVHAEADILCAFDVGFGRIAVLCGYAEERGEHKYHDQQHRNDQMPCFAFCLHKIQGTSKSSSSADAAFISCCAALVGSSSAGWPSCRPFCDKTPLTAEPAAQRR